MAGSPFATVTPMISSSGTSASITATAIRPVMNPLKRARRRPLPVVTRRGRGRAVTRSPRPDTSPRRRTTSRAATLITIVMAKRVTPSAISASIPSGVDSWKVLTILAAIVSPCWKMLALMAVPPPIRSATAIVSPSARPRPSMVAPMIPGRLRGTTIERITSQRVAPRANPACRSVSGTAVNTSRTRAVMIGMIMIASTTPAKKKLKLMTGPAKSGMKPSVSLTASAGGLRITGAKKWSPHSP